MKKSAILGLGVSGKAILRYLLSQGIEPLLFDKNPAALVAEKDLTSYKIHTEEEFSDFGIERIIVSPGIGKEHPIVQKALHSGLELTSEIEIAFESLSNEPVTLFAITGSSGKTTTTTLVTHVLTQAGRRAKSYGNIGYPLINYWLDRPEYLVVELSSYQLENLQKEKPILNAATILNIEPNHLDHHSSLEEYVKAKMRIGRLLKKEAPLCITQIIKEQFGDYLDFNVTLSFFDQEKVAPISSTSYRDSGFGEFAGDVEDSQAAYCLCKEAEITKEEFCEYAKTFQKPEHRCEFVSKINGVAYINDSKATTVTAVIKAVQAFRGRVILIAGGVDKGMDFSPWQETLPGKVHTLLLIGKASATLAALLCGHLSVREVGTLESAVASAFTIAQEGDVVLLSPGCASFDQFMDYQQRGKRFKELVLKLKESS